MKVPVFAKVSADKPDIFRCAYYLHLYKLTSETKKHFVLCNKISGKIYSLVAKQGVFRTIDVFPGSSHRRLMAMAGKTQVTSHNQYGKVKCSKGIHIPW